MFYTPELLYFRGKGQLARCWLAATLSEELFKRTVRQPLRTIDVSMLCDQILSTIQTHSETVNVRFSLYLSSQLMFGAARLLSYKTKQFQDALFTEYRELYNVKDSRGAQFDISLAYKEMECLRLDILYNQKEARDMHLMTEYPTVVEHAMQEPYFGALTDCELEMFLLPHTGDQFLSGLRGFLSDQPLQISEQSMEQTVQTDAAAGYISQILKDWDQLLQISEEPIQQTVPTDAAGSMSEILKDWDQLPQISEEPIQETVPTDAADHNVQDDLLQVMTGEPSTSSKRPASPQSEEEHPAKRRKISSEEVRVSRRRRPVADKKTVVSNKVLEKRIGNVAFETTASPYTQILQHPGRHGIHSHPAKYDFEQHQFPHRHEFASKLTKNFLKLETRPVTEIEFPDSDFDLALPDVETEETVREAAQSKIHERTVDISNKMAVTAAEIGEQSKTAEHILINIPQELPEKQILDESSKIQTDKSAAVLPEITGFEETIGETTELSPTGKHFSPNAALTKKELGALLEVHWDQGKPYKGLTTFHEIISPDTYTKIDAVRAFDALLGFHAEKRVVLKQAKPYDTIWIEKCARHSSESSEGTV